MAQLAELLAKLAAAGNLDGARASTPSKSSAAASTSMASQAGVNQGQECQAEAGLPSRLADGVDLTSHGISVKHLERLLGGELLALAPRMPWAQLLRRTHGFDVLRCAGCGGRLRLLAAITDKAVARAILAHLDRPAEAPSAGARDPTVLRGEVELRLEDLHASDTNDEGPQLASAE